MWSKSKIQRYICEDGETDDESVNLIGLKKIICISFSFYFKPKQEKWQNWKKILFFAQSRKFFHAKINFFFDSRKFIP